MACCGWRRFLALIVFAACMPFGQVRAEEEVPDLQAVLEQARPGETIELQPGT